MKILQKLSGLLVVAALLNVSACGYFLYPERVGQKSGRIDPAVVILDGAGLLFGILPGVVAFAVDLTTGAIYLSGGQRSVIDKHGRNLTLIDGLELQPVPRTELTIDQSRISTELSMILDKPVAAEQIRYYKATGLQSIEVAALQSGQIQTHF